MIIHLHTDHLTKFYHFFTEAMKIVWRHKKTILALTALPMLADLINSIVTITSPSEEGRQASNLFFSLFLMLTTTFFTIAWLRFLLDTGYQPNLKTYFAVNKRFFQLIGYTLLIFIFYYGIIWSLERIIDLIKPNTVSANIITLAGTSIALYFLFPVTLVFPALATDRSTNILKILTQASPYRTKLFFSIILLLLMAGLLTFAFYVIIVQFSEINIFIFSIISTLFSYIMQVIILNLAALYYKKYIMDHKI